MQILVGFYTVDTRNPRFIVARKLVTGAGTEFEDRAVRVGEEVGEG